MTMALGAGEVVAAFIIPLIHLARTERILSCDVSSLEPCGKESNEVCNATSRTCQCLPGLVRVKDVCEAVEPKDPAVSFLAAVFVTLLFLGLMVTALVLVARKFHFVSWVRQEWARRHDPDYEDVMIGADDPPLRL